jgi:hypothetical protein
LALSISWLTATILSLLFTVTGTKFTRLRQQEKGQSVKIEIPKTEETSKI